MLFYSLASLTVKILNYEILFGEVEEIVYIPYSIYPPLPLPNNHYCVTALVQDAGFDRWLLLYRLSDCVKLLIALGILLTYGLQLTVTADLAWQGLRTKLVRTTKANGEDGETPRVNTQNNEEFTPRLTMYYYGMRFGLILGSSKYYFEFYYTG